MSQSIKVMIATEGPRLGIDPRTSSPQGEYANNYTNGERLQIDFCVEYDDFSTLHNARPHHKAVMTLQTPRENGRN